MSRPSFPNLDMDRVLSEALSFAGVGLYRYTKDGTVVFMDRASLCLLDIEEEFPDPTAVVGRDIGTLFVRLQPQGTLRKRVLARGRVRDFEYHYRTLSGKERWVHHNSYAVRDPVTGEEQIQVIAKDITAIKEAQAREREQEARAQQSRKLESLGVLAGGIAHDFNNLLAAILGNTELARMDLPEEDDATRHLAAVTEAATQAAGMCQRLLAYAGRSKIEVTSIDINDVVAEALPLLRLSAAQRARLQFERSDGLLPTLGDVSSIRQILLNLVTNAVEALGDLPGAIRVRTGRARYERAALGTMFGSGDLAEGDFAVLTVEDDGPGMSPETAARIFEPFFTTKFTGRGLGLASVLGFVSQLQGAIEFVTKQGQGSRFSILLPVTEEPPLARRPAVASRQQWQGERALLAEDEPMVRDALRAMLKRLGFTVLEARDGLEAVEVFKRDGGNIRLAVLDLTMPQLDGAGAADRIRHLDPAMPVLFSSGYDARDLPHRLSGHGPTRVLRKPYGLQELRASVAALLEGSA